MEGGGGVGRGTMQGNEMKRDIDEKEGNSTNKKKEELYPPPQ